VAKWQVFAALINSYQYNALSKNHAIQTNQGQLTNYSAKKNSSWLGELFFNYSKTILVLVKFFD
jgi:hypothetical protein